MRRTLAAATAILLLVLASTACSRDHGSKAAFCKEIKRVPSLDTVVQGFSDADPQELTARLKAANASYAALHKAAPKEIRGQVGEVEDLVDVVTTAVQDHHDDPEAAASQIRKAMASHPDAKKATVAVAKYAKANCDVDLNPTLNGG